MIKKYENISLPFKFTKECLSRGMLVSIKNDKANFVKLFKILIQWGSDTGGQLGQHLINIYLISALTTVVVSH